MNNLVINKFNVPVKITKVITVSFSKLSKDTLF